MWHGLARVRRICGTSSLSLPPRSPMVGGLGGGEREELWGDKAFMGGADCAVFGGGVSLVLMFAPPLPLPPAPLWWEDWG